MMRLLLDIAGRAKAGFERTRNVRRLEKLQDRGMTIGKDVFIPLSTWIDVSHCYLISIGDRCRFGPNCSILAHDATMNEFLDAGRIGRVTIHESCSFGFGTIIMPGVEIGPRVIAGAYSIITTNIPPDSVVANSGTRIVGKLQDFLRFHKMSMRVQPRLAYKDYGAHELSAEKRAELSKAMGLASSAYITGGYSGMLDEDEFFSGRGA